jgi:hypothetical protein
MLSWDQIQQIMQQRRMHDAPIIRRMVDTRDHANGDITLPLVNVQGQPEMNFLMPFMVSNGIENTAMRAAGPLPNVHVPAVNQLKLEGTKSLEWARTRRRAYYARWHRSRLPLLLGRAYRQLVGYGTFSMVVVPEFDGEKGSRIEFRDALGAYPSLRSAEDVGDPINVGFVSGRSAEWVLENYPEARDIIDDWRRNSPDDGLWDMVEWLDEDQIVIGLLGPRSLYATDSVDDRFSTNAMLLRRWDNRAGMVPAVTARRVTLDRVAGQMEKIIPMEEVSAKLMALDFAAAERFVFPDMVVIGDEGRTPQILGQGGWRDGRTGDVNLLQNVKAIQQLQGSPGPMTNMILDRIERNASISSGNSPFMGGETTGSLRTGRAIDALGGYSVDPRIAELQIIMAYALETVNRAICEVEKGYFADHKFTVFSGWASDMGHVEYTPGTHFETSENVVTYTFPGSDVSDITVQVAQLNGAKLMSRHTARDRHPFIEDAENEERLIVQEAVDDATLVAWEQQIASGQVDWQSIAEFRKKLAAGMSWPDAILEVNIETQQRQAAAAQQQAAAQAAGPQAAIGAGPSAQPGLGGGPQTTPSQPPPGQGVVNVASMTRALAAGARGAA